MAFYYAWGVIMATSAVIVIAGEGSTLDARLACCALETRAALLVSATISQKLAQDLACATSGGPYWDSPAIVPGLEALGVAWTSPSLAVRPGRLRFRLGSLAGIWCASGTAAAAAKSAENECASDRESVQDRHCFFTFLDAPADGRPICAT
jgi:hypothetical protein